MNVGTSIALLGQIGSKNSRIDVAEISRRKIGDNIARLTDHKPANESDYVDVGGRQAQ